MVGRKEGEETSIKKSRSNRYVYRFLYAVSVSGQHKTVLNSLPRAVAVLSNSKRLFLSHLDVMFRCLDPSKAELCYVDTDSCIWSLSHPQLELCLRADRRSEWERAAIIADENGVKSCHGLMKLEGTYASGLFKNIKMYRLFAGAPTEDDATGVDDRVYTRCKGVNRTTAARLNNEYFFQAVKPPKAVVHRSRRDSPGERSQVFGGTLQPQEVRRLLWHSQRLFLSSPVMQQQSTASVSLSGGDVSDDAVESQKKPGIQKKSLDPRIAKIYTDKLKKAKVALTGLQLLEKIQKMSREILLSFVIRLS